MWRDDDEALLGRLEDQVLLETLWTDITGGHAAAPHPRASGLVRLLRDLAMGEEAAQAALDGELAPLRAMLQPRPLKGLRPELLHHLALFFESVARVRPPQSQDAVDSYVFSIAAWLALGAEHRYLEKLARTVAADALDPTSMTRAIEEAPLRSLESLGARGSEGATERRWDARLALRVLGRTEEAIERANLYSDHPLTKQATRTAARLREEILDRAIRPVAASIEDANARSEPDEQHVQLFADAVGLWRWADEDVFVERFIVRQATSVCWELYNRKAWSPLRLLNAHLQPVVDRLAMRIEADPSELAYAAPTAQMLVFRAELDYRFENQLAWARRAVAICDTHRNGRLVYADLLAERALRTLERAPVFARGQARESARQDVVRALELWPDLPRIAQALAALRKEGVVIDE